MKTLVNFLLKKKILILFLLIEIITLVVTFSENNFIYKLILNEYTYNKIGLIHKEKFFLFKNKNLLEENKRLNKENASLHNDLLLINNKYCFVNKYHQYIPSKIINNTIFKKNNILCLDKGVNDGVKQNMGVINPNGIVGIIVKTSKNFSLVKSILNTKTFINVRLKKSKYFGVTNWDGKNYNIITVKNIPKTAIFKLNDIIETDGKLGIFPEGINVGKIINITTSKDENTYDINIKLFNDMAKIEHVYIIKNIYQEEINFIK